MLEIRKSGADKQQNQNTLILEVTQERFLIGWDWCCHLSCVCQALSVSPLFRKKLLAQHLLPSLKNGACFSRNRSPLWNPESVSTAAHPWEVLTVFEKPCGCLTPPFQFRWWLWGDPVHHCSLSWRGSRKKQGENKTLCVSWCWAGWKKPNPKTKNNTCCTGMVSLLEIWKNTCAQISLSKHQFCLSCSSSGAAKMMGNSCGHCLVTPKSVRIRAMPICVTWGAKHSL